MIIFITNIIITGLYFINNFFGQFEGKIFKAEKIDTHGGSLRIYIKKDKKIKNDKSVKKFLKGGKVWNKKIRPIRSLVKRYIKLEKCKKEY